MLTYKKIIAVAFPVVLANLALPLQAMIDTAIIGHLDSALYLTAVGLAAQLFLIIFVSFNFLQYATSGLSAQALGEGRLGALILILLRALLIALVIAFVLILFQTPILLLGQAFFNPSSEVSQWMEGYYRIRIWGSWAELSNYALIGWFAGQGLTKQLMYQQLLISLSNVGFNLFFVFTLDMGVAGVALGTVLANIVGLSYGLTQVKRHATVLGFEWAQFCWQAVIRKSELLAVMVLNRDLFLRSSLLTLSFAWITRLSAQQGELLFAANLILLQILHLASYSLDGVAVATEGFVGQAYGQKKRHFFRLCVIKTSLLAVALAVILSLVTLVSIEGFIRMMTSLDEVQNLAKQYQWWAIFIPLAGVFAYQADGVFFAATANKEIRYTMLIVVMVLFPASLLLTHFFANHGVWMSIYLLLGGRGVVLFYFYPRVEKRLL